MKSLIRRLALVSIIALGIALALPQSVLAQSVVAPVGPVLNPPTHPLAPMQPALSPTLNSTPAQPAAPTPAAGLTLAPAPRVVGEQFDGIKLYHQAFEVIRALHIKLDTLEKLEAFTKEWEHKYDNSAELSSEKGTDKAILTMLQSLGQRFDYFLDKEATKHEREEVDATLTGIGAIMRLSKVREILKSLPKDSKLDEVKKAIAISKDNGLQIEETLEGGPAEKFGLKFGDTIRKVGGKDLNGMQMKEAVGLIPGLAGSQVMLTVERKLDSTSSGSTTTGLQAGLLPNTFLLDITVTRARITVPDVKFRDLGNGVSYVKLRNFMSKNAIKEMRDGLRKAAQGKGLILDLRDNPGGSLTAVLTITGMLLEDGPVIVQRSRIGDHISEAEITLNKKFVLRLEPSEADPSQIEPAFEPRPKLIIPNDMPIIVLVDEGSASASEILSGALQYNRRAIVVGMPTVGKGVGQNVVPLLFGRSLHVTSFEFVPGRTPNDWIGVIPNVKVEDSDPDSKVDKQLEHAQKLIAEMIKDVAETNLQRDEQLKKNHEEFELKLKERGK